MTTLVPDHSIGETENLREFVTQYLEGPDRAAVLGAPKAPPVTLKLKFRAPTTFAAVVNHGWVVTNKIATLILRDGRVDVRNIVVDTASGEDEVQVVELLPWVGDA